MPRNNRTLAGVDLERFKYEVASELAPNGISAVERVRDELGVSDYDALKYEIAQELGIPFNAGGYNGQLTAHDAGRIGGRIGGNMVKRMIALAEEQLARTQAPPQGE